MKKSFFLIFTFLMSATGVFAQEPLMNKELVLHCRDLSSQQVEVIRKQLKCLESVHLTGYYLPAKCLFITYDEKKIGKSSVITSVLLGLNKKLKTRAVNGYTIYDIIDKGLPPEFPGIEHQVITFSE